MGRHETMPYRIRAVSQPQVKGPSPAAPTSVTTASCDLPSYWRICNESDRVVGSRMVADSPDRAAAS
jgi:hypothetical protein